MPQTYYFVTFSVIWYRTQKMTCFLSAFVNVVAPFFSSLPRYYCVTHKCVSLLNSNTFILDEAKKTAKCYALNLNFPRPLNIAIPICDRHLFCDLLRICLRCPGCVQLNIEFEWTKFAKRNMKNKRLSMFSNKNRTQIHLLKNMWVFVRFFFTLEIFSFIDNPNNPFRWLVKIEFFLFHVGVAIVIVRFSIDDVCDVVTNTTDKAKRNAQVFAWKKRA